MKKKNIKILDCTLRDGGSLNNWLFGGDCISQILQALNNSGIDVIEAGFTDNNVIFNPESALNPCVNFFDDLAGNIVDKKTDVVAMIDLSKYNFEKSNISSSTSLNGIRLMFKKNSIARTLEFCEILQNLNYNVSLNPVSVTGYSKNELVSFLKDVNCVNPQTVYIVDTYGLLNKKETLDYYDLFNNSLKENITIGYHAHNNMQTAFSNSVELVNIDDERNIIIDSSLYGMGKRAGNVPTELITQYLNTSKNGNYNIDTLLQAIEKYILPIYAIKPWGYSLIHYIAAKNKCHSDYVSYLHNEKKLSFSAVNTLLSKMEVAEKLSFNKNYIDLLLEEYYE